MKKLFTFLLSAFIVTMVMGQAPTSVIKKASVSPVVDGLVDDVWAEADPIAIDKPYDVETPTTGDSWWKMLWTDEGLYLLTLIDDDVFVPAYMGDVPANSWMYDKLEIYFDVNYSKADGLGPQFNAGHYQIAPTEIEAIVDGGTATTETRGEVWAFNATDNPKYYEEFFFPFSMLLDKDGNMLDKSAEIGFDVNIMDNDVTAENRQRMNWANAGPNENWANMDGAGTITLDGAEPPVNIDGITISGASEITTDGGTLTLSATLDPIDATQVYNWKILEGTEFANINKTTGQITAKKDGVIKVVALSSDLFVQSNEMTITISGQILGVEDMWGTFNLISNWDFNEAQTGDFPPSWGGWVDVAAAGCEAQILPKTEDGVIAMQVGLSTAAEGWHYQLNQSPLAADPNVEYTLKFKSWASADNTPCAVDFESGGTAEGGEQYNRYGATSDPESGDGRSEWHYNVGTTPAWFTFHVTFDQIVAATVQKVQWMNSLSNEMIYLDSVLLIKSSDIISKAELAHTSLMKVYPNPVGTSSELTVMLTSENAKVSIFNSIGQKMIEKASTGNIAKFNIASLSKGIYFVRLEDGTTTKFIK